MRQLSYTQALSEAINEEMARDETVFSIGEDIGSVRKRDHLWEQYRRNRTWQTPISEAGFTGLAVGAAMTTGSAGAASAAGAATFSFLAGLASAAGAAEAAAASAFTTFSFFGAAGFFFSSDIMKFSY